MAGALFNILIPTEQHEIHLSRHVTCDCSTKYKYPNFTKQSNDNIHVNKSIKITLSISMEKVSTKLLYSYNLIFINA